MYGKICELCRTLENLALFGLRLPGVYRPCDRGNIALDTVFCIDRLVYQTTIIVVMYFLTTNDIGTSVIIATAVLLTAKVYLKLL